MCGRYAASRDVTALAEIFDAQIATETVLGPDYNVAPTKLVNAVLERHDDVGNHRVIDTVKWGLVPSWAKDPSIGAKMINARVETVADKPAFRRAFAKRRALLPADGYFEWQEQEERRSGKPVKQPYFIHPTDGSVLAMAALYELWRDPTREESDPRTWVMTATVITTSARDELGQIHDRMPVIVAPEAWGKWLDPQRPGDQALLNSLEPASVLGLTAYPVSTDVNLVRNNGPQLVAPIQLPAPGTLF